LLLLSWRRCPETGGADGGRHVRVQGWQLGTWRSVRCGCARAVWRICGCARVVRVACGRK
jgi:hypothetical protein